MKPIGLPISLIEITLTNEDAKDVGGGPNESGYDDSYLYTVCPGKKGSFFLGCRWAGSAHKIPFFVLLGCFFPIMFSTRFSKAPRHTKLSFLRLSEEI